MCPTSQALIPSDDERRKVNSRRSRQRKRARREARVTGVTRPWRSGAYRGWKVKATRVPTNNRNEVTVVVNMTNQTADCSLDGDQKKVLCIVMCVVVVSVSVVCGVLFGVVFK